MAISLVVNTRNEQKNISRCLRSAHPYVDEIVVVDMESTDKTVEEAKKFTKKIWKHRLVEYVEPARNFAISKATSDWILILDADEVLPATLGKVLRTLSSKENYSFYRLPRRNLIFGRWMTHSGWWPDYQIRFFKAGTVTWNDEIHSIPLTQGEGHDIAAREQEAIQHHHYESIDQYLERLNRYTTQEAKQLIADGYVFSWPNIIRKPSTEFVRRFFAWEGYKDGVHGLALALLQSFSMLVVELKIWEHYQFKETKDPDFIDHVEREFSQSNKDFYHWYLMKATKKMNSLKRLGMKFRAKLR